jgi:hypothetical protein
MSLTNPATWKMVQNVINVTSIVAAFIPGGAIIIPALAAVNAYLTTATSGRIGL